MLNWHVLMIGDICESKTVVSKALCWGVTKYEVLRKALHLGKLADDLIPKRLATKTNEEPHPD